MIFTTESGSKYEIESNRIRRLSGTHDPTSRQGSDGEWKEAASISMPTVGESVLIVWEITEKDTHPATITSPVVGVE